MDKLEISEVPQGKRCKEAKSRTAGKQQRRDKSGKRCVKVVSLGHLLDELGPDGFSGKISLGIGGFPAFFFS